MAAFIDVDFGTATVEMPATERWTRGTESEKDREGTPLESPKAKLWEPLKTGEPVDERERGEYLRGVKQPSQSQAITAEKSTTPIIVAPENSGNTKRIELSRSALTGLKSFESSLGQLSAGTQLEDFKRTLASSYLSLHDTTDSAQFLTIVSLVEEKLVGTDLTGMKEIIPTLRTVFRLCFELPRITDMDVSTVRDELSQVSAKSVPLFMSDEQIDDDEADDLHGEEEA